MAKNFQDTDLFLVNRGADSYKATFADLKDSLTTPLVIGDILIKDAAGTLMNPASNPPTLATGTQLTATPQVSGGDAPYTNTFQWKRDNVTLADATTAVYTVTSSDVGKVLTCTVDSADSADPQNTATKTSNPTGTVEADAPDTPTLLSPVSGSSVDGNNFTMLASDLAPSNQTLQSTSFQVSATEDFTVAIVNETVASTSLTVQGKIDSGAMAYDTTYYARCLQTNTDGKNSAFSAVTTFTTNEAPPQPTDVDMSGLRFDSTRQSYLQNTKGALSSFTFSHWVKWTSTDGYMRSFVSINGASGDYLNCQVDSGTGKPSISSSQGGISSSIALTQNEWQHVLYNYDGTTATIYVNGVVAASDNKTYTAINSESLTYIGKSNTGTTTSDGYLSEVYFVENQVLEPGVFAKSINNGTWVPKPNTDIKATINAGPASPYSERANTSQNWSSQVTPADSNTAKVFNGDITQGLTNTAFDWTTSISGVVSLEIFTQAANLNAVNYSSITVNGVDVLSDLVSGNGWNTISNPPSTLTNITTTYVDTSNKIDIFGIKVNGRLLVDSTVWNNSENWSGGPTNGNFNQPVARGFDGDTSTFTQPGTNVTAVLTFPAPFTASKVEALAGNGQVSGVSYVVTVNGAEQSGVAPSAAKQWITLYDGAAGSCTNLKLTTSTGGGCDLYALRADGKILVDAGAQYNTSEDWTGNVTGELYTAASDGYWTNAFDGNTTTRSFAPSADTYPATTTYTFGSTPINTSLRVWVGTGGNGTQGELIINGSDVTSQLSTGDIAGEWVTITGFSSLTSVGVSRTASSTYTALYAVEVDGKILVTPGFGPSGFYLPFDPETAGALYPAATNMIGTPALQTPGSNLFNADLQDVNGSVYSANASGAGINWMPTSDVTGKISLFLRNGDIDNTTISWNNGGDWTDIDMSNRSKASAGGWYDIGNITIAAGTGISVKHVTTAGSNNVDWRGIAVDGVMLVDHESVGVDDSGNNNDFYTQSFGIGNASQAWSLGDTTGTHWPGNLPEDMFDGSLTTKCAANDNSSFTLATSIYIKSTLSVYCGGHPDGIELTIGGVVVGVQSNNTYYQWVDIPDVAGKTMTLIDFTNANPAINAFRVDGKVLVNPPYLDTVIDTPVSDYSVAQAGTNGNLENTPKTGEGTGVSSLQRNPANTYYAEFTGSGEASGASNSYSIGVSNSAPDVFWTINGVGGMYLGDAPGNDTAGFTYTNGDIIGLLWQGDTLIFYKNGVLRYRLENANIDADITNFIVNMNDTSPISIFSNYGQQPFQYAINNNDGTAFVNPAANQGKVWSSTLSSSNGFNASYPAVYGFDGVLTPANQAQTLAGSQSITWTFNAAADGLSGPVRIWIQNNDGTITDGSGNVLATYPDQTKGWVTLSGEIQNYNNAITIAGGSGNSAAFAAIEVNGRILVDAGLWNQSQVWSDNLTGWVPVTPSANAFDGDIGLSCESVANGTLTYTGAVNGNLKLYRANGSANDDGNLVNVGAGDVNFPRDQWVDFGTVDISSFTITDNGTSSSASLSGMKIDDVLLVDGQVTADLLVEKISEQDGVGTLFYDENEGGVTTLLRLMNRYGFTGAKPGCGIYQLTEQPDFEVANYIKSGDYYVPTRSYSRLFKCLLKAVSVDWAATTAFTKDQIVEYNDLFYCVTADHTTGSSFDTGNLHIIETAEAFTTAFAPAGQTSSSSGGGGGSY